MDFPFLFRTAQFHNLLVMPFPAADRFPEQRCLFLQFPECFLLSSMSVTECITDFIDCCQALCRRRIFSIDQLLQFRVPGCTQRIEKFFNTAFDKLDILQFFLLQFIEPQFEMDKPLRSERSEERRVGKGVQSTETTMP